LKINFLYIIFFSSLKLSASRQHYLHLILSKRTLLNSGSLLVSSCAVGNSAPVRKFNLFQQHGYYGTGTVSLFVACPGTLCCYFNDIEFESGNGVTSPSRDKNRGRRTREKPGRAPAKSVSMEPPIRYSNLPSLLCNFLLY